MKKTIKDFDLYNKKVLIRCDFNVPLKDNQITDDNRIIESLQTINYAIEKKAKIILFSHLGRVETEEDKKDNSLRVVAYRLSQLLNKKVLFIPLTRGKELEEAIKNMNACDIILVENTRYEDIDSKKESKNDEELGKYWASLGDIYINDAFGTCHRSHASNVGIASHLDNGIGFLVEKEIKALSTTIENPNHPFTVILGGAKVADKIGVIKNIVTKADYILIGGGMAYTFLKAQGYEIGKSLLDVESITFCNEIIKNYKNKIILPVDNICALEAKSKIPTTTCLINEINQNEIGLDIGPKTIDLFKKYIEISKTIIWNGPVGCSELDEFASGTKALLQIVSNSGATTIIGGGDTAAAAINFGYGNRFTHVSTGGGASLEMLEGKILPGIGIINEKA